ncbi:hypothetical protein C8R43DRAFT_639991 [Mycena crocata]|nr:hypothetical protein C8R43DRAFT_639991 [Mycena crocata]
MHRALHIPELIEMICESLQAQEYSRTGVGDLHALARTCKFFLNPSLNVMWRKQYDLRNLVDCMPSDLWESSDSTECQLRRPINDTDWERFFVYASRITHFVLSERDLPLVGVLNIFLPRVHLLPNLDTLECFPGGTSLVLYIRPFLSPRMQSVHFELGSPVSDVTILQVLGHRYPGIRNFTLNWTAEYQPQHFSLFVRNLTQIERLTVEVVDVPAFQHLRQLTTLKSLDTSLAPPAHGLVTCEDTPSFTALRLLKFRDTTADVASEYIPLLFGSMVPTIEIDLNVTSTAAQTTALYTALAANCAHRALRSLEIVKSQLYERADAIDFHPATYVVPSSSLLILRCFTNIVKLRLQPPAGFDLDDETVFSLARAWPSIRHLLLQTEVTDVAPHSRVSLGGLSAFARHCQELEILHITLNAISVPRPPPEARPVHKKLWYLHVGLTPIVQAGPVAAYLSGMFPSLGTVASTVPQDESDDENGVFEHTNIWVQVNELMPVMRRVRAEERASANHHGPGFGV